MDKNSKILAALIGIAAAATFIFGTLKFYNAIKERFGINLTIKNMPTRISKFKFHKPTWYRTR